MVRSKLFICFIILSLLAGCSAPVSNMDTPSGTQKPVQDVLKEDERSYKLNNENVLEDNSTPRASEEDSNKAEPQPPLPAQPPPVSYKGERLDFNILDKLDNTRYSWWITMNSQHKTPGIPPKAQELISKHDGIYVGDTGKKAVYLTFDEGYENGYTPKILDTLKENDVKALFFVTGPYVKGHGELVKRMLDEGHLVGNHSVNHPSLPMSSDKDLENELYGLEKQFSAKFGKGFKYMRPPRGEYSEKVLAAAKQLGYKTVFWSFAYRDFETNNQKGADYAYNMVMKNLHNGAVILLHAVSRDNAEALDRIIKDIKSQGYTISPFDL